MTALTWRPVKEAQAPPSKPDGDPFKVVFLNRRDSPVELHWMNREGEPVSYGLIDPGKTRAQSTRPGAVWRVDDPTAKNELGHFVIGDRKAKAIIPKP